MLQWVGGPPLPPGPQALCFTWSEHISQRAQLLSGLSIGTLVNISGSGGHYLGGLWFGEGLSSFLFISWAPFLKQFVVKCGFLLIITTKFDASIHRTTEPFDIWIIFFALHTFWFFGKVHLSSPFFFARDPPPTNTRPPQQIELQIAKSTKEHNFFHFA